MRGRGNSSPRANSRGGHGGSNYHNQRANSRGGRGSNHHNPRANFRGGRGRGRGGDYFVERPNFRDRRDGGNYGETESFRDERGDGNGRYNIPPKLSIPKIKELQQRTTIANFSSSKLTYGGSDQLVFIVNGERITTVWKKILEETPWYQKDIRIFICSALVTADSQKAGELVTKLSNPKSGLDRLSEIMNFPMSCDAGLQPGVLSFQYVILPLLGLLTRTAITKCTLEKHVDDIFMVVYEKLVSTILWTNLTKLIN
jgi:hypothetical protein